jgi:hypothetical protein
MLKEKSMSFCFVFGKNGRCSAERKMIHKIYNPAKSSIRV